MIGRNAAMALFHTAGYATAHSVYITLKHMYSILRSNHFYLFLHHFQEVFFSDTNQASIQHIATISSCFGLYNIHTLELRHSDIQHHLYLASN